MLTTVAIMIGSKRSQLSLVRTSLESIKRNLGTNIFFIIGVSPGISVEIVHYLTLFKKNASICKIIWDFPGTWAEFMNEAVEFSMGKWILMAHDDVNLITPNLIPTIEEHLGTFTNAGWITLNDNDYLNGHWAPCVREGWHIDAVEENAWAKKKLHQFHRLPDDWFAQRHNLHYIRSLPYDVPSKPVKCHCPFSHFNLIELSKLKSIGKCENWTEVSLLVDEDWGLRALQYGYFNVWMPMLTYTHIRGNMGTRAFLFQSPEEKEEKERQRNIAGCRFYRKWGFQPDTHPGNKKIKSLLRRYAGTNVFWSLDKRSYEWDYLTPVVIKKAGNKKNEQLHCNNSDLLQSSRTFKKIIRQVAKR